MQISQGRYEVLHGWLRENVYAPGRKYTANELIQNVTGAPLSISPYIGYLRTKYGDTLRPFVRVAFFV